MNENTNWINQTLFSFRDSRNGSDGYMRLSLTTSTEDYNSFSPPFLMLSISNKFQKTYKIDFHHARDLVATFKRVFQQSNGNDSEVRRRNGKNVDLLIKFYMTDNKDKLVRIELLSNETDFTKILIDLSTFVSVLKCIEEYTSNYFLICKDLFVKSIDSFSVHELPDLIKNLPGHIQSVNPIQVPAEAPPEVVEEAKKTETSIEDLDNFLGGKNMDNIFVPEIDRKKPEKPVDETESRFAEKFLENDLLNFEKLMANVSMSKCPQLQLETDIMTKMDFDDENLRLFGGASEKDIKSTVYCSQTLYAEKVYNYMMFGKEIEDGMTLIKYDPDESKVKKENTDLAIDFLTISMFIKCVRTRLKSKFSDAKENRSLFHTQLRAFVEPFVYSYLTKIEPDTVLSMVARRYETFEKRGVFKSYGKILSDAGVANVIKEDAVAVLKDLTDKGILKAPNVEYVQNVLIEVSNYKLSAKNDFTLEQIINEVIPLEIASQLGKDITDPNVFDELRKDHEITDDVWQRFRMEKNYRKPPERKTTNHILRYCKHFDDEVPDNIKEEFWKSLEELQDSTFDFRNGNYNLDEFGENIVKALYIWDPSKHKNYKEFVLLVEEEPMQKDLIIAKYKNEPTEESMDWDFGNL